MEERDRLDDVSKILCLIFAFACSRVFQTGFSSPHDVRDVRGVRDANDANGALVVHVAHVAHFDPVYDAAALLLIDVSPPSLICFVSDHLLIHQVLNACDVDVFSFLLSFIINKTLICINE